MTLCPCGSKIHYQDCCEKIHLDHELALYPEQLMRARYCAHVLGLVDFIVNTYHPSCQATKHREGIIQSVQTKWLELQVLNTHLDLSINQGFVEFKAFYIEGARQHCLHEKSRFLQENIAGKALWFYLDGEYLQQENAKKVSRNDPCACGSGKKFKKCCG